LIAVSRSIRATGSRGPAIREETQRERKRLSGLS
jgi:hypothetical protein